ncbi:hypothetical protein [Hymenobacter guriensis]|uniref:Uncharacterized protein n=1 Tax=Hymenobacter guriensis TaxID=2793065 RepID=A0ABS0L1N1_9BACT|nr:hypothetical protein [Hymenobacter guriensis]MBG8554021.1 hypothetical protein [Hymenobacter guriensis]
MPRYLYYYWDEHWLGSAQTWDDFTFVWMAATRWGWPLQDLHKCSLLELWQNADRLAAEGVPYIQLYAEWLVAKTLREENANALLLQLFLQLHVAEGRYIPKIIDALAYLLLNRFVLHAGRQQYQLTDIEFYYRRAPHHNDPYVHGGPEQEHTGTWFYNLAGGLDLTCGDRASGAEGGILLRGLRQLDGEGCISGIQLVLRELVTALGGALSSGSGWWLGMADSRVDMPVWRTTRQGLVEKEDPLATDFRQRPYRFLADAGYVRTLRGKEALVVELLETGQVGGNEVAHLLGYKPAWLA